ncbi:MAG: hypothetical protein WCW56_01580 [Candidatus Paceibacterota bacterium]|jgi:hypothetical protein
MILSTHSIVGASFAGLLATDPATAFAVGLASHYLLDMVPHWDYQIGGEKTEDDIKKINLNFTSPTFISDLSKITLDFALGLIISYYFLVHMAGFSWLVVLAGIIGGVLPDFLQFLYSKFYNKIYGLPLVWFQKLHDFFHTDHRPYKKRQLAGATKQFVLVAGIIVCVFLISSMLD